MSALDGVRLQVVWSRLISVADEIATTLVKTAFSLVVRDNHDYACGLYDSRGRMLAQSTQCTPGQAGSTPTVLRDMLAVYPPEALAEGDVLICNDPWVGAGHAPDVFVAAPIFHTGRLVGFACTCAHHVDMGGRLGGTDAREVFEEGVIIPVSKLVEAGRPNDALIRLIKRNVRTPDKVMGDLRAQMAAAHVGAAGICRMIDDFGLDGLDALADAVAQRSEAAFRARLGSLPRGVAEHEVLHEIADDAGDPIRIRVRLELTGDAALLDFTGTTPQVARPINAVLNITRAYAIFPFVATLCPDLPMNDGVFRPIGLHVPEGTVLNPTFPAAGMYRSLLSYFTVEAIMAALHKIAPELTMAPSGSYPLWIHKFAGQDAEGRAFVTHYNAQGGQGAFTDLDGHAATVFPGNVAGSSAEAFEREAPMLVARRGLIADSGGPGRQRGGLGQETVLEALVPIRAALSGGRLHGGAPGMAGGGAGAAGAIRVNDDAPFARPGPAALGPGDRVTLTQPGGGGFGPALTRDPALVAADVAAGYVSAEAARSDYGVALDAAGRLDAVGTAALRGR